MNIKPKEKSKILKLYESDIEFLRIIGRKFL